MKRESFESVMSNIILKALDLTLNTGDQRFIDLFAPLCMSHKPGIDDIKEQTMLGNDVNASTVREEVLYNALRFLEKEFADNSEELED